MQATKLLHKTITKSRNIHKKRADVLLVAAETLTKSSRLSVVGLGRGLVNKNKVKHNINRMDRLIGNDHLYAEKQDIYRATTALILQGKKRPIILIDWSSATIAERFQLLRAAIPVEGRSLTIYEEVHPLSKYNNRDVHRNFLNNLSKVLPNNCCPIIVTDAGFGIPWFKQVRNLGWDFVGRVINNSRYTTDKKTEGSIPALLKHKSPVIKRLGEVHLSATHKFRCYLQVSKKPCKGRVRKNVYGEKAARNVSIKSAKSAKNAWVLAHSLGDSIKVSERVEYIYGTRMKIEESFRDIKSTRFGFSMRYSRSLGIKRLSNLFLIGLLGTLIAWLVGICAKHRNLDRALQTNSIKNRNVLSIFSVGREIVKYPYKFTQSEVLHALNEIKELIHAI